MKTRVLAILGAVALLFAAAYISYVSAWTKNSPRVHQHRIARQPSEEEQSGEGWNLSTHLPIVMIDTLGQQIPGVPFTDNAGKARSLAQDGRKMIHAKIKIIDNQTGDNHPSDEPAIVSDIDMRIRGNSSRYFPKKSYRLDFLKPDGANNPVEPMGMQAHHEWALYGPYLDKTLIRNYLWYNLAGEMMDYAPNLRFCEVMLNGEYRGLYLLTETITRGKNSRLRMRKSSDDIAATGYVLRLDRGSSNPLRNIKTFANYSFRSVAMVDIVWPETGSLNAERIRFIENDFSAFEKSLYSYDYNNPKYGLSRWINLDAFADYFIINELALNYDAGALSTYVYRDLGGKINPVIWDFNSASDNYRHHIEYATPFVLQYSVWYSRLMKDNDFVERIIARYRHYREGLLSDRALSGYIDETIRYLGPAVSRNFSAWGGSFKADLLLPKERNLRDYDSAVFQFRDTLLRRANWMDDHIEMLRQYCHPSRLGIDSLFN